MMTGPVVAASAPGHAVQPSEREPTVRSRETKGGRRLWYALKVLQQPERARACGSGPKSSADRRPVDPPPVVELRIFEGPTFEQAQTKDVTFQYNANFFLFATLEHARVIAHGRVQAPGANMPPVLSGMPVSGMAYLDRPKEAGYFLFPDLSVRHEGRYRFTFHLYEETKDEHDKSPDAPVETPLEGAPTGSFDFRMDVQSEDFVVYSAKKFPGLAESTTLSRIISEQGCRVRIRRDIRMRRRDGKGGNDYETNREEEFERRKPDTPDAQREAYHRARSMSGSVERSPYSADTQRRSSLAEYPPQFASQAPPSGGHLQFLGGNSSASQYPPASQHFAQPPSMPPSPSHPPAQGASYPYPSTYSQPPAAAPHSYYERPPSQPYGPVNPSPKRDEHPHEYGRRVTLPPLPPLSSLSIVPSPTTSKASLPNFPPLSMPSSLPTPHSAVSAPARPSLSMASPTSDRYPGHPRSGSYSSAPAPYGGAPAYPQTHAAPVPSLKRGRDEFCREDDNLRLANGSRDSGDVEDVGPLPAMAYRRADGTKNTRMGSG